MSKSNAMAENSLDDQLKADQLNDNPLKDGPLKQEKKQAEGELPAADPSDGYEEKSAGDPPAGIPIIIASGRPRKMPIFAISPWRTRPGPCSR